MTATEASVNGAAYVVFGRRERDGRSRPGCVDRRFQDPGEANDDRAGWSVSSAGDVNGDGLSDLIVGAPLTTATEAPTMVRAYVVFGQDGNVEVRPRPGCGGDRRLQNPG